MKKKILIFIITILLCSILNANENNENVVEEKLDKIYNLQKKMYEETKQSPLDDKSVGIELNLFRLLMIDESRSMSGTVSLFAVDRKAEIAFPFYGLFPKDNEYYNTITLDCHYRFFLKNTQNGLYLSAFTRFAHLYGYKSNNYYYYEEGRDKAEATKLGFGFGVGYRIFSYRGFYWGTSLSFGRYVIGKNDVFNEYLIYDDDREMIIDFEFLKFGWAF